MTISTCFAQYEGHSGYAIAVKRSEVASSETGVVSKILVVEGEEVSQGQALVLLDDEILRGQLESAKHEATNRSELDAILARKKILERSLETLRAVHQSGHARANELAREELELEALKATYSQKTHEYAGKQIQVQRILAQLEKRVIRAPFHGQIAKLHHRVGEFVSPNKAEITTLVDLSHLIAEVQVPLIEVENYKIDQEVKMRMGERLVKGNVHFIGVLVDRASQTVTVKVRIDNTKLKAKTGTDCVLITPFN